ncbi:MAG: hypothetical protein JWO03_3758 [Bacteroidetes bacterium]|nr:hypothetical protein [Bacteroidota bacterium]
MIYDLANWPDNRYSGWKERGRGYEDRPRITDCIDKSRNSQYDMERLITYLSNGYALAATSWMCRPSLITGEKRDGSFLVMTDGSWVYNNELMDYISNHGLAIPDRWYDEIVRHDFIVPTLTKEELYAILPPPQQI